MKKQPEIHSRIKYFSTLLGEQREKDRSKAGRRKRRRK